MASTRKYTTSPRRVLSQEEKQKIWDAIPEWRKDAIANCLAKMIRYDLEMQAREKEKLNQGS